MSASAGNNWLFPVSMARRRGRPVLVAEQALAAAASAFDRSWRLAAGHHAGAGGAGAHILVLPVPDAWLWRLATGSNLPKSPDSRRLNGGQGPGPDGRCVSVYGHRRPGRDETGPADRGHRPQHRRRAGVWRPRHRQIHRRARAGRAVAEDARRQGLSLSLRPGHHALRLPGLPHRRARTASRSAGWCRCRWSTCRWASPKIA